jgi:uncharacterized protein (TIGR02145 family)
MKQKNTIISFLLLVILSVISCDKKKNDTTPPPDTGTVTDVEGNVYKTIKIGTQVWMAENLKVTKYRNGSNIPYIFLFLEWERLSTNAYCETQFGVAAASTYGYQYNWYAATDTRGLAPAGWHIPSRAEWQVLINFLGGNAAATDKLKEAGTTHWTAPNTAVNSSGFTALGTGFRFEYGSYSSVLSSVVRTAWWSSTTVGGANTSAVAIDIYGNKPVADTSLLYNCGLSIRCVKD